MVAKGGFVESLQMRLSREFKVKMLRKRRGSSQVIRGGEDKGVGEAVLERIQKLATSSESEEETTSPGRTTMKLHTNSAGNKESLEEAFRPNITHGR